MLDATVRSGWGARRAYLASVYAALDRERENFDAEALLSELIAAIIEKSGTPAIATRLQAGVYATSADPDHRAAAASWFDGHPEEYA